MSIDFLDYLLRKHAKDATKGEDPIVLLTSWTKNAVKVFVSQFLKVCGTETCSII